MQIKVAEAQQASFWLCTDVAVGVLSTDDLLETGVLQPRFDTLTGPDGTGTTVTVDAKSKGLKTSAFSASFPVAAAADCDPMDEDQLQQQRARRMSS